MGLDCLPWEVQADAVAGDDCFKMVAQLFGCSRRPVACDWCMEHFGTAWDDVVEAKASFFVPVDTPAVEIDVSALEDEWAWLDHEAPFLTVTGCPVTELELLAPLYGHFYPGDGGCIGVTVVGGFVQIDAERATQVGEFLLLVVR